MSLIRWTDPFAGMTSLHQELDDMFNEVWGKAPVLSNTGMLPATDIYTEDDKQLVAEMHIPGFTKEDVDVNVHDGYLEIKGQKATKEETGKKKRNYVLKQSQTSFYRRFALPKNADASAVQATFEDGVLKVTVPFKELPAPKKIAITSGKK